MGLFLVFDGGWGGFLMWVFNQTFSVLQRVEVGDMGYEKESQRSHKKDREGRVLVELCAPHSVYGVSREERRQRNRRGGEIESQVERRGGSC